MSDSLVLLHTGIAIAIIVVLIMAARLSPVIAILAGSIYLGLAGGLGFEDTATAIGGGFGTIMGEVGLLIALGVLLGAQLSAMGTLESLIDKMVKVLAPRRLPLASSLALTTLFPVIYGDVLLVLMAPVVRALGPRIGPRGIGMMSTALGIGINVGLVFVIPGSAAIAIAGLLGVDLGTMFVSGLLVALPTAVLTMVIFQWLANRGMWNPAKDEMHMEDAEATPVSEDGTKNFPPLRLSMLPIVIAIVLIASGVIARFLGLESGVVNFVSNPVVALFLSLVVAFLLTWKKMSKEVADSAITNGFRQSGIVLIITGAGGSLAEVIGQAGLEEILGGYFSAGLIAPLLLAWVVAAILQAALGSATVAIITAGGILAPVIGGLGVPPILIALAASSGSLFGIHLSSSFFWIFQPLIGLTTQGTLKSLTLPMAIASLLSLGMIMAANVVL